MLATTQSLNADQTNQSSSGTAGIRPRTVGPLPLSIEGEIGRTGTPFTPISCSKYRVFEANARYFDAAYFELYLNTVDNMAGNRFELQRSADPYAGYHHTQYTGEGRGSLRSNAGYHYHASREQSYGGQNFRVSDG